MPKPTVVWMVREGDPTATEGTLSIDDTVLRFAPAGGAEELTIPFGEITKVRRARGGPLLSLFYLDAEGDRKLYVYFAKPPPLPGERPLSPLPRSRWPRGLERAAGALALRASSRLLKRDMDAWVGELRRRGGGG